MSQSKMLRLLLGSTIFLLGLVSGAVKAAPVYTYSWTTTSQGYGMTVGQPSLATFDVAASAVQSGVINYNDIFNIHMAYPGLAFDNFTVSSGGFDAAVYVDAITGALIFKSVNQGLSVFAYAGNSVNDAQTWLSITIGSLTGTTVKDGFNAFNQGAPAAGYPTKGFWTARLVGDVTPPGGTVPEPASLAIVGMALAAMLMLRRRLS